MDSPMRRSGIPIPKTKTNNMKKSFSKSNDNLLSDSCDGNQSNELDLFTLLEENIGLKEKNEELMAKHNNILQKNVQFERENSRIGKQFSDLKVQQKQLKDQLQSLMGKFQREIEDGQTIHNIQEQQKRIIDDLMEKVRAQEEKHVKLLKVGKQAKSRLEELAPEIHLKAKADVPAKCDIVTTETVEQLINEIGKIKTQMNNTELQLYEANEKIAELVENHQHLKEENENLKVENSNLTKVAKLMTNSMKESMDTSKRMEEALIEMKKRNDELVRANKDAIDSPTTPKFFTTNDQVMHLTEELKRRDAAHTERIVEMHKVMETTIETNNNDEINVLRIKLEVVENELQIAISRAEKAEQDLEQLRDLNRLVGSQVGNALDRTSHESSMICSQCGNALQPTASPSPSLPPPPPPPMPKFSNHFVQCGASLKDGISSFSQNNTLVTAASIREPKLATGMDALINELRNGTVTLRRRRKKTETNAALQEMFETLELTQKQNRSSRIFIENHK